MHRMVILADDLSGAADCGTACVCSGFDTVVALGDAAGDVNADVLAIDADTRRLDAAAAASEVSRLLGRHLHDDAVFFKKIDSTLRGHVGAEIAAVLDVRRRKGSNSGQRINVLAPAFPANGRTTVNGIQLVHGQYLKETEIWRLQGVPGEAEIAHMLRAAGLSSAVLELNIVRSGVDALSQAMVRSASDADVLICDAQTDDDLRAIASTASSLGPGVVWIGSAGLAYHLPKAAGLSGTSTRSVRELPCPSLPTLFAIGSLSTRSQQQVATLVASSDVVSIILPPKVLLSGPQSSYWLQYECGLDQALKAGRDILISVGFDEYVEQARRPLLSAALAEMVAPRIDSIGALVASGGETARMILQASGVTALRLLGELERGVPISVTENWRRPLPIITKAGDFGGPETLLHAARFLRGTAQDSIVALHHE